MLLIAGLGNPGKQYEKTRHNFGFLSLDALADNLKVSFSPSSNKCEMALASNSQHGKIVLVKPQTFMNKSGESVGPIAGFYKIAPTSVMAVYDDLDLPLGRLRFAKSGSAGGHNGVKSLIQHLGTQDFPRLKLGIGRPLHPGHEVVDYVLQKFSKEESALYDKMLKASVDALNDFIKSGISTAMNRWNGFSLL